MKRLPTRFLHLCLFVAILGCNAQTGEQTPTATVSGKATLPDGKPLPGGRITFELATAANKLASADIKLDGTYEAIGVPQGECKITIDNRFLKPIANPTAADTKPDPSLKYVHINDKFSKAETSGLSTTVVGPTHHYDVELR